MSYLRFCAGVLVCFLSLPATVLAFVAKPESETKKADLLIERPTAAARSERIDPAEPTAAGAVARSFLSRHGGSWEFRVDRRSGSFDLVQGSGIPMIPGRGNDLGPEALETVDLPDGRITAAALEPQARAFIAANPELLGPPRGSLVLSRKSSLARDADRLVSLSFDWLVGGIPVEDAQVYIRINSGNITQFGARLIGPIDVDTEPVVDADQAFQALVEYSGDEDLARRVGDPELLIQAEDEPGGIGHRLIWRFVYRLPNEIETWEGRVDARTGLIVGFRDINEYARVVGGVYPRTVLDDDETVAPMPLVDVVVDGAAVTSDNAGFYAYSGGRLASGLNGRYFDTNCTSCSNPPQPVVEASVGSGGARLRGRWSGRDR